MAEVVQGQDRSAVAAGPEPEPVPVLEVEDLQTHFFTRGGSLVGAASDKPPLCAAGAFPTASVAVCEGRRGCALFSRRLSFFIDGDAAGEANGYTKGAPISLLS